MISALHLVFVHLLCLGIFSGAALYINVCEHPARMQLNNNEAVLQWQPSYVRAFAMQASLMVIVAITGFLLYFKYASDFIFAFSASVAVIIWLYTLFVMLPTNNTIMRMKTSEERSEERARTLLNSWNVMHLARTLAGIATFVTVLFHCVSKVY